MLFFLTVIPVILCQPPLIDEPFPLLDETNYNFTWTEDDDTEAALGSTPSYWDGEIRTVNGVNVISTPKSESLLPGALDIAEFTIEFMTSSLQSQSMINELSDHNVYIYHCDPTMRTGIGLGAKQGQYDYVSDLLNYDQSTHDGRAVDNVYGYGGTWAGPTSTCDCNVLGTACSDNAYATSSILVHEFGHTIMNIAIQYGMPSLYDSLTSDIFYAYQQVSGAAYQYCGSTADEMWACAVQTWLQGTSRTDVNPGIYTIDLIYQNVPSLYNALYQVFGQPPKYLISSLSSVSGLTNNQWQYYDFYVNTFGDDDLKSKWNSIRYVGSTSTVTTTRIATTKSATSTSSSSGSDSSGTLECGGTVSGTLSAGGIEYFPFTYTDQGSILMYPCHDTAFSSKLRIIDYYWNEIGSNSASYYDACYDDMTVWAYSTDFSYDAQYWLIVEGLTANDYGKYSVTMYCYDAGSLTVTLETDKSSNSTPSIWTIIAMIVLISIVINSLLVYCLVRYYTKRKMKEFVRKQTKLISNIDDNHKSIVSEEEIEIDVEMETTTADQTVTR